MYNIKFKVYKNRKLKKLNNMVDTSAHIWNHCVLLQKRYYTLYGGYIHVNKLQKHIAKLRKKNKKWSELNSQSVQELCQRLDMSYQRFFNKISKRPPKFKNRKHFTSFVLKQSGWKLEDNVLTINKTKYKFIKTRSVEKIKRITVKRDNFGDFYFVFCCDMVMEEFKRVGDTTIGIDFGLKNFLNLSDGTIVDSPEFYKESLDKLKRANKSFSKKKRGSKNRKKSLKNLQRVHRKVFNKREDFEWKLAHYLCKNNSFIAIEDLDIESMKKRWGRKVSDLSYSSFVLKLEHVANKYNTIIQKIDRWYPSSKKCGCGVINEDLKLTDRVWTCKSCNTVNDRDLLASNNILSEGIRLYRTKYKTEIISAI